MINSEKNDNLSLLRTAVNADYAAESIMPGHDMGGGKARSDLVWYEYL
jgi:hypothetical protein